MDHNEMSVNRTLSVCMLSKNSAAKIGRALKSAAQVADEIIVIDQESTDGTDDICRSFGAKVFSEDRNAIKEKGFGYLWNKSIEKATCEWILILASDEFISPELGVKMKRIVNSKTDVHSDLYFVLSIPLVFGRQLRSWSGQVPRLFRRGFAHYDDSKIMERLIYDSSIRVSTIPGTGCYILNHTYDSWEEYISKMNLYTELEAEDLLARGVEPSMARGYYEALVQIGYRYLYRKGFLEGEFGLRMAIMAGFTRFLANAKYAEKSSHLLEVAGS